MNDKEKRIKQVEFWMSASKLSIFVFVSSMILLFVTTVFSNVVLSISLAIMAFISMIFPERYSKMLKPARQLYEELEDESILIRTGDLEIFISNSVFRDRFSIKVCIPKLDGAEIIYTSHKIQMCDVFKAVLEDRKISAHEFYIRYIEDDVLDFLTEKLKNENAIANKRHSELIVEVNKFIDRKEVK